MQFNLRKTDPALGAKPGKTPKPIDQMSAADIAAELAEELLTAITSLITTQNDGALDADAVIEAASKTALQAMRRRHGATTDRSNDPAGDPSLNPTAAQRGPEQAQSGSVQQAALPADVRKAIADTLARAEIIRRGGVDSKLVFDLGKGRASAPGASSALLTGDSITFATPLAKRDTSSDRITELADLVARISKRDRQPLEFSAVFGGGSAAPLSAYTPLESPSFTDAVAKRLRERDRAGAPLEKLLR
ncbi:hypothetical protein IMX07_00880 [bacterium]|nr:hypothetical protein [bacterium]